MISIQVNMEYSERLIFWSLCNSFLNLYYSILKVSSESDNPICLKLCCLDCSKISTGAATFLEFRVT